jgi:hypothetical protein
MFETVRLQILLVALAGWVNRHQLEVIAYLREENRILKEHLGGRRLRFTDAQRRRLALNGQRLGRRVLDHVATLVTPDTILRWHRRPPFLNDGRRTGCVRVGRTECLLAGVRSPGRSQPKELRA